MLPTRYLFKERLKMHDLCGQPFFPMLRGAINAQHPKDLVYTNACQPEGTHGATITAL